MLTREQLDQALTELKELNLAWPSFVKEASQWLGTIAEVAERFGHLLPKQCDKCDTTGVISCQPFPCEHGGHTCSSCGGRGTVVEIPDEWIKAGVAYFETGGPPLYELTKEMTIVLERLLPELGKHVVKVKPKYLFDADLMRAVLGEVTDAD